MSLTIRTAATAALSVALLAGCSSGDEASKSADPSPSSVSDSPTVTTSPTADPTEGASLAETCPQVEAALPASTPLDRAQAKQFNSVLRELFDAGDLETQNALRLFAKSLKQYDDATSPDDRPVALSDLLDADQALLDSISAFAARCKAVGSSALQ